MPMLDGQVVQVGKAPVENEAIHSAEAFDWASVAKGNIKSPMKAPIKSPSPMPSRTPKKSNLSSLADLPSL